MGAIRAEMPCVSIASASIGVGHSCFVLFSEGSGLQSHGLKTQLRDGRKPNARRVGYELRKVFIKISNSYQKDLNARWATSLDEVSTVTR